MCIYRCIRLRRRFFQTEEAKQASTSQNHLKGKEHRSEHFAGEQRKNGQFLQGMRSKRLDCVYNPVNRVTIAIRALRKLT